MALRKLLFSAPIKLQLQSIVRVNYCSSKANNILDSADEEPLYLDEDDTAAWENKRNKSKLSVSDRNKLFDQKPYNSSQIWYHDTVKYKKRILGRYGLQALDVPAGMAWPTLEEVHDYKEYERVAFPLSIQERLKKIKDDKKQKEEALIARQHQIEAKMANMQQLMANVQERLAKKQAEEEEARLRKEQKIEAIRQKLIAEGSMTRESLSNALAMAEKEEKKKKKEAKKAKTLARQERLLKEMSNKQLDGNADVAKDEDVAKT